MKAFLLSVTLFVVPSFSNLNAQIASFPIVFDSIYPLMKSGDYLGAKHV